MAKTILTPFQNRLLDILATDSYITRRFYFTGGTVLSEFYLQHRLSEDLDLFNEIPIVLKPFKQKDMERFFIFLAKKLESEIFKD